MAVALGMGCSLPGVRPLRVLPTPARAALFRNAIYATICPVSCQADCVTQMYGRKTAVLNLRIAPELKTAAEKAAADDNRALTSLIEVLLMPYLRQRGYLSATDAPTTTATRKRSAKANVPPAPEG